MLTSQAIAKIEVVVLAALFSDLYGSEDDVPPELFHPAASHSVLPRRGQYSTLVFVETESGEIGIGEAYGLPAPDVTARIIVDILAPLILGRDARSSTALWSTMFGAMARGGQMSGFYVEALSGVDLALWDLRGKIAGAPAHILAGGPVRSTVPTYASPVPLTRTVEESVKVGRDMAAAGFTAIKVKIGGDRQLDVERLRALREELGDEIEILVDANCAYRLDEATEVARELCKLGISWFEEPLAADDLTGMAELRRRTGLTIVSGENMSTSFDLRNAIQAGAIDVVMPNLARCGGLTEALRMAAIASAFHVGVSAHGVGSGVGMCAALQFLASIPECRRFEYNRLPNPLRDDLLSPSPAFLDGRLAVPNHAGLGFSLAPEIVEQYCVSRSWVDREGRSGTTGV